LTTEQDHAALRAGLRQSLSAFIRKVYYTLNPGGRYIDAWHVDAMANKLELCRTGSIKRLIITSQPRSLKSMCASVALPAFTLGHDPTARIICVSYSDHLALKHARDFRKVIESTWYSDVFPQTIAARNTENEFETTRGGYRYATSVGGPVTGFGCRILVLDDLIKTADALSRSQREKLNDYFANTLYTRLDSKINGAIVLVQQRVHEDDLVGRLLKQGGYTHINFSAIAKENVTIDIGDGRTYERKKGTALIPQIDPLESLEEIKRTMGSFHFSAQYQQEPVPETGNLIQRGWFRYVDFPPNGSDVRVVQSWDTATKGNELNDYSVGTTWLMKDGKHYLIDVIRQQCDYPTLRRLVLEQYNKYRPTALLIEDSGSGTALIQDLKEIHHISSIAIRPEGDKVTRLSIVSPRFEAGEIYFLKDAPWLPDLFDELLRFPQCWWDDQVDSISQYLIWDRRSRSSLFEVFWPSLEPDGPPSPEMLLALRGR
jgi:predicted phage terminase large subunit-like protein